MAGFTMDKEFMVKMVKACGQEVIDRAEDLVGEAKDIADLDIWIRFNCGDRSPTIELNRQHYARNIIPVLQEEFNKSH